jgi:hypothetical protein
MYPRHWAIVDRTAAELSRITGDPPNVSLALRRIVDDYEQLYRRLLIDTRELYRAPSIDSVAQSG